MKTSYHWWKYIFICVASVIGITTWLTLTPRYCRSITTTFKRHSISPSYSDYDTRYFIADSITGHRHVSHVNCEFLWPEHTDGRIFRKTNNFGFRENADTTIAKPENTKRILITGDSHVDGVVNKEETYPNVLEQLINKSSNDSKRYEIINAAVGYFGPQNYLSVLKRWQGLSPDVFIVTIYSGNDFLDAIKFASDKHQLTIPERPQGYYEKLSKLDDYSFAFTGQLINQIQFFKTYPDLRITALTITENTLFEIQALCETLKIKYLVVILPTKVDIEPQTDIERIKKAQQIMEYSENDLSINGSMAKQLGIWLFAHHIPYIDLTTGLSGSNKEVFWKSDYHLNSEGHRVIGNILFNSDYASSIIL